MSNAPLVSLILCVKNGMPYLPEALESVKKQTYRNIELVIQDGNSSDGTLEVLKNWNDLPNVSLASFDDGGVGQAERAALARCSGELLGTIDSDNLLEPIAVASAVRYFEQFPNYAAVYGAQKMIRADSTFSHYFFPKPFDLLALLECELVPPFGTSFFNVRACGDALYFDKHVMNCNDFPLWLRLARFPIGQTEEIWGSTRLSDKSMSCNPKGYDGFIKVKVDALRAFYESVENGYLKVALTARSIAGVYIWAAESVFGMDGLTEQVEEYFKEAKKFCPGSPRLSQLANKFKAKRTQSDNERLQRDNERLQREFLRVKGEVERLRNRWKPKGVLLRISKKLKRLRKPKV